MIHSIHGRIGIRLERMNMALFVGIFVAFKAALAYVSEQIYFNLTNESIASGLIEIGNIYFTFVVVIIFGPLIETYLIQYLFFKYLLGRISQWLIVVLSAFVFALFHTYNIGYVFYAFFSGLILSTSYALRRRSNPFVCTLVIHSIYNLLGFIYNNWR
jgi:membrane protease YdiL (CAAX protease family)